MNQNVQAIIELLKSRQHLSDGEKASIINVLTAQKRELEIEAALERVRAKAMSMQTSHDLLEVANVLREQMGTLGQPELESSIVHLYKGDSPTFEAWYAYSPPNNPSSDIITDVAVFPKDGSAWAREVIAKYKSADTEYTIVASGEKIREWYKMLEKEAPATVDYDENGQLIVPQILYYHFTKFSGGALLMISNKEPSREACELQKRAAKVFELAYTRFLDLQKAEAQAREAQIEVALEKVRSRSLTMHNSNELKEVVTVVFDKLKELDFLMNEGAAIIIIFKEGTKDHVQWIADSGQSYSTFFHTPYSDHSIPSDVYHAKQSGLGFFSKVYSVEEKNSYFNYLFEYSDYKHLPGSVKQSILESKSYGFSVAFAKHSAILIPTRTGKLLSENQKEILKRFVRVFDQAYTRFLDLQKAEAQAREAKIETAMEKVRSRALAMQKPSELVEVAQLLRNEMGLLGVEELEGTSICIHKEATGKTDVWYAIKDDRRENKFVADYIVMDLNETWVGRQMLQFYYSERVQISIPMQGINRMEWISYCSERSQELKGFYEDSIPDRTYHLYRFPGGFIGAQSPADISAESWDLLQRATSVFSLAYTRFNDLQQAETQARESRRQAALDRVRAEIASMRTAEDLKRITPLVWKELTELDVPFFRCGVFIINERKKKVHLYLSTPEGKPLTALHFDFDNSIIISNVVQHWRIQKVYQEHWNREQFTAWVQSMIVQEQIADADSYQAADTPPESLTLYFVPFAQGMMYVGSAEALSESEIELVQALAEAFSVAYARYEDFSKLEEAKNKIEKTLHELKATQAQLIQREKMASLGDLTAGIAHEIQNPLNFVNNFSEVNKELIAELKEEIGSQNLDEIKILAHNLELNEEKILYHGRRADAIVKNMLQHSRKSTGQKELTDMNALTDEYLRLSYHGFRAKDKSFNATIKTHFDEGISRIEVIPQDIGSVLLNLFNNSFYSINEKKKKWGAAYEPIISVTTKKEDRKILIIVRDNGTGISQKTVDKIFQPFFTTKPTGEGTGLGLSLSYDIIKAHGGEIMVNTKEGEFTEIVIQLPSIS